MIGYRFFVAKVWLSDPTDPPKVRVTGADGVGTGRRSTRGYDYANDPLYVELSAG